MATFDREGFEADFVGLMRKHGFSFCFFYGHPVTDDGKLKTCKVSGGNDALGAKRTEEIGDRAAAFLDCFFFDDDFGDKG